MRKVLLIVVAVVVIAAAIVVGTRLIGPSGPRVVQPFTFDFKPGADQAKSLVQGDDMATLLASSPFYESQSIPGQNTQEFDQARARKVDQIIADSDRLAEDAIVLKSDVDELRKALCDYLTICAKNDPKTEAFAASAGREVLRLYTLEAATEAVYKSTDTSSSDPFTRSYMQYMKSAKAVQLGALYLQDIDNIAAFAAVGLELQSGTKNPKIAEAGKTLDDAMGKVDGMSGRIGEVMSGMRKVNYGFKQLATADYYFARTAVKFMRDSMPQLKAAAGNMKPHQCMDAQAIASTKTYLAKFDNMSAHFQKYLDSVPQSQLVPITAMAPAPSGCAFASYQPTDYGKAYTVLATPARDTGEVKQGWLAAGWNGLKKVVHGTQSAVGVGLDVAGTAVKNITRVGAGIYYGNSAKEIWKDMKDNSNQIIKNWNEDKSGSEIMHNANGYINAIDEGADYIGSAGAEKIFGQGWTSWGIGKVSKATASIFTGLGKGITLVGNRDAQASDYAIGAMEIGSSFLGGSKLVLKGSQLPEFLAGLGKTSWLGTHAAYNAAGKLFENVEKANIESGIRWATKEGFQTVGFEMRQAINQAMMAAIEKSNAALKAELGTIIDTGLKAGWANFNGTLRESLEDLLKKEFTNNIKGLTQALATAVGKDATTFGDNVVAQWAEDVLKELVDQAMAQAPLGKELKGVWTGTTVFTSIEVPEAAAESAAKDGCNIGAAIKALKDKPMSTSLRLDGAASGSGNMVLQISASGGSGHPVPGRYSYDGGVVRVSQGVKGGVLAFSGEVKRMTQGYAASGPISFGGTGKQAGFRMSGKFDVTKSH